MIMITITFCLASTGRRDAFYDASREKPSSHDWENRSTSLGGQDLTTGILLALVTLFAVSYARSPWRKLPPGPRRLPVIGNALQLTDTNWLLSRNCKEDFGKSLTRLSGRVPIEIAGEVMYLDAAGQPTIVLNSLKAAFDLLECRASKYSDRPRFVMVQEVLSNDLLLPFQRNGERWRRMRRTAHEALTKSVVKNYHSIQMKEATILVSSLLASSAGCNRERQFQRLAASTVMSIVYDYRTLMSEHDQTIERIDEYVRRLTHASTPGSFFVNIFPWMMYIPERFARWKREGLRQYTEDYRMFKGLLNGVRVDLANGSDRPSFSASLLQRPDRNRLNDPEMTFLAGALYGAGSETTSTTLSWWMLTMMAFPEVQRRAQAELDAVVGRDRLPTLSTHLAFHTCAQSSKKLFAGVPPYRSECPTPRAKTTCMKASNIWHCNHDRAVFGDDADEFRPERHLDEYGEPLPGPAETNQQGHVTFGFGRRICVAKHLANDSLFINTARVLWAANLERVRDENGRQVPLDMDTFVDVGVAVRPAPYDCVVTPRFPEVASILAEERERFEN
ncbi:cytochrome P450 [Lactifluus subvellereus]|nr:cytochrome P450 [Lactifluus subvellereus]